MKPPRQGAIAAGLFALTIPLDGGSCQFSAARSLLESKWWLHEQ